MKNIAPISILVALISCTQIKYPTAGTYTSLGGDTNSPAFNATLKQIQVKSRGDTAISHQKIQIRFQ